MVHPLHRYTGWKEHDARWTTNEPLVIAQKPKRSAPW